MSIFLTSPGLVIRLLQCIIEVKVIDFEMWHIVCLVQVKPGSSS